MSDREPEFGEFTKGAIGGMAAGFATGGFGVIIFVIGCLIGFWSP